MARKGDGHEQKRLVEMLVRGNDAAKQFQLQLQLGQDASQELKEHLVETILSTFTNVFSILKHSDATSQQPPMALSNSPRSLSGSPKSNNFMEAFREPGQVGMAAKKRKMLPRWTEQVRLSNGSSSEGQLEDGYNWRKYGQKDILGSKFPRSYYRCTHKSQGCQATKQVQRSSNDPSIFEVIYRGTHICPRLPTTPAPTATTANATTAHSHLIGDLPLPINFQMGLTVKTREVDNPKPTSPPHPPLFSLPPPMEITSTNGIAILPSPAIETPGIGTTSSLGSPVTSESNYLGVCPVSWPEPGSVYEPANALSGPHSATSSGMVNGEFTENSIDHIEPNNFPFAFFFS